MKCAFLVNEDEKSFELIGEAETIADLDILVGDYSKENQQLWTKTRPNDYWEAWYYPSGDPYGSIYIVGVDKDDIEKGFPSF